MLANVLQIAGGALLVVGVGLIFGYAVGIAVAGAALVAFGVALERGN
jgi:hypothetical protein